MYRVKKNTKAKKTKKTKNKISTECSEKQWP